MSPEKPEIYEFAGGEITVWVDGCICIKTRNTSDDPVELADDEAVELAALLMRLAGEGSE